MGMKVMITVEEVTLGRRVDVNREVMDDINRYIMKEMVKRCKVLLKYAEI